MKIILLCHFKQVQTVYRNCMTQNNLEAFVLMATEKSILSTIDSKTVNESLSQRSKTLHKLLAI